MKLETVFLDRDGVINRDSRDYIKRWEEFEFLPGSRAALARLTAAGLRVILITNQSAVNRGMITREVLADIHDRMRRAIQAGGGRLDDIFVCPHRPDENCTCRKPAPDMILGAVRKYGLNLSRCAMVGDSARDVACGVRAGCGRTVLVTSGINPAEEHDKLAALGLNADHVAPDLPAAVDWLLAV
jgi:D-glycero-D-manno-heptose 1,7-bisphosphate phosphatase